MLLRTVVVLLLCASSGLCATLGHYQTEERVVEDPVDSNLSDSAETPDGATTTETRPPAPEPKLLVEETAATEADVNIPGPGGAPADGGVKLPGEALVQLEPSEEEASEMTPLQTKQSMNDSVPLEDNGWSISSIRNSFQKIHGYVDSLVELVGGRDGVCEYRCRHGEPPEPRPGYQHPEPNGCSSSLVGFQLDMGIPAMTKCCNHVDVCYDTCGANKYDCDSKFRSCLHDLCSDLKRSLGFVSRVQACESMADTLYNTVWMLGCRPYMISQRAACVCSGEQRDEL